jgi:hypothetical protein
MKTFLYILLISLLFACNGKGARPPGTVAGAEKASENDSLHHYDSLFIAGKRIPFLFLEQREYDKLTDQGFEADGPNDDSPLIQRDAAIISKIDSNILISCTSGKKVKLTEHTTCDGDNYIDYTYGGMLGKTPFLVFKVGYYEKLDYLLINLNSGKEFKTWGMPSLSPDSKTLLSASFDLDVGFLHNGLQLLAVDTDSLRPLWEHEFENWGPAEVKWFDSQTLFIKQSTPIPGGKEIVSYARVKLDQ